MSEATPLLKDSSPTRMFKPLAGHFGLISSTLAATLLTASVTAQSFSAKLAAVRSLAPAFSPDVLHYGTPSGQVATPHSRVQVFGFPTPGATIQLQVVGARPNVDATFYVASAYDDVQVPGLGRVLVDANSAQTHQTTTDGNGRGSVTLTLPTTMSVGEELFVQCNSIDSGSSSPTWDLSTAACIELGSAAKPIRMVSHLAGGITLSGVGSSVSSTLSGVYAQEWAPDVAGSVKGSVAVHTLTSSVTVNGVVIEELRVQPGVNLNEVTWTAGNFLHLPVGTADEFLVSFTSQSVEYGPYAVAGTMSARLGGVNVNLGTIPTTDSNPLGGASITLAMSEVYLGPEYFAELDASGLPLTVGGGALITPRQVSDRFDAGAVHAAAILAAHGGDTAMFSAVNPAYLQYLADEGVSLFLVTEGRASNAAEVQELINTSQLVAQDGLTALALAKICALLGVGGLGLEDALLDECADELQEIGTNLDAGEYKKAAKSMGKMLDKVMSKKFAKKLADKIGAKAAGKVIAKTAAKCVPLIGWGILAVSLIWSLAEQYFD